jgi:nucleotide-sensitive chloride channel 1A
MQLAGAGGEDGGEDMEEGGVSLTIIPQSLPLSTLQTQATSQEQEELLAEDSEPTKTPTQLLFAALSACSNLHPDPYSLEDGEDGDVNESEQVQQLEGSVLFQNGLIFPGNNSGGLPPAMPGSGGWITAENVHDYFDEEGNWRGNGSPLGPGAGTVRAREEEFELEEGEGEADGAGIEETKWRRTG